MNIKLPLNSLKILDTIADKVSFASPSVLAKLTKNYSLTMFFFDLSLQNVYVNKR
jgi:hypothetical protein